MEVLFDCRQEGSEGETAEAGWELKWYHLSLGEWVASRPAVAAQSSASAAFSGLSGKYCAILRAEKLYKM